MEKLLVECRIETDQWATENGRLIHQVEPDGSVGIVFPFDDSILYGLTMLLG
jgi:hypothetical protein